MERVVKLIQENNPSCNAMKDVDGSQSAESKSEKIFKRNGVVKKKRKHTGRQRNTSKRPENNKDVTNLSLNKSEVE